MILNDELEEIGKWAFYLCMSLHEIVIPNAVKTIKEGAFNNCTRLTIVNLGDGLEEIEGGAFHNCKSLQQVVIPNVVKTIKAKAFVDCRSLTSVIPGDGLGEIGEAAFAWCGFEDLVIPPAVKRIHHTAFQYCSNLSSIKFCDEIEKFVSCVAMRGWWNRGVYVKSLSTYCFLVRCSITERFSGLALVSSWQANINNMLRSIPAVSAASDDCDDDVDDRYVKGMNAYFDSIDAKLTAYENLMNQTPVLFPEQFDLDHGTVLIILSFM